MLRITDSHEYQLFSAGEEPEEHPTTLTSETRIEWYRGPTATPDDARLL